jgi:hypothetical protein
MRHFKAVLLVLTYALFTIAANAQDTNAPRTALDAFESRTGVIIVRGSADLGSLSLADGGAVSVQCRQSIETPSGGAKDGLAVTISYKAGASDRTIIDYSEIDSFINALAFLSSANWTVTTLPSFDAFYTTRDGLQAAAYSSHKQPGTIGASLKSARVRFVRVSLTPQELADFRGMIQQAKAKLDLLHAGR